MKIPRYWASSPAYFPRGGHGLCWRWSSSTQADAQQQAQVHAAELTQRLRAGQAFDKYSYGDRPLREEIIQTMSAAGEETAVITRNIYGALVLNTARAMFIDVDFRYYTPLQRAGRWLRRLITSGPSAEAALENEALEGMVRWAGEHAGLGLRVYRTAAGLRGLVTSRPCDPAQPESIDLLRSAGSDPLYVRLCQTQVCFRARLTPKPWRCGMGMPPARFPRTDPDDDTRFQEWLSNYERASQGHSVCRLLRHLGPETVHPELAPIIAAHDQHTMMSDRSLA